LLGREAFLAETWKWVKEYGGKILTQQQRMGASVDWDREVFTMDETRSVSCISFKGKLLYKYVVLARR
jgi:valyl-tRNA synthetase